MMLAIPNAIAGCQQTASVMVDDILTETLPIASEPRWGLIEKPGLGVEVDEVRLKQYADLYRLQGQFLPWAAADND